MLQRSAPCRPPIDAGDDAPHRFDLLRALLSLAVAAAVLFCSTAARAELDLQWSAPKGCPQRQDVMAKIRAIAGSALDDAGQLSVAGRITREARRARLELLVSDGERRERREITSESCSALAGAAAVTLTLLMGVEAELSAGEGATELDPNASATAEQTAVSETEEPLQASSTALEPAAELENVGQDRPVASDPSPSSPRNWAVVVRAPIFAADIGPLPRPALGIGLAAGLRYRAWSVLIAAQLSSSQSIESEPALEGSGAELQRAAGQLLVCHGWRWGDFEATPCLALGVEHVSAQGFGDGVSAEPRRAVWPAPGLAAVAHWHTLESLALFATVSGHLELSRPRLVIEDLGEVRQLGPAALGAAIGLEWIL